jgi:archaellin
VNLNPNATNNRTAISYQDAGVSIGDLTYTTTSIVGNGDLLLQPGELFEVAIDLTQDAGIDVRANETFSLEVKPPSGSYMVIQRTLPPSINETIVDLN